MKGSSMHSKKWKDRSCYANLVTIHSSLDYISDDNSISDTLVSAEFEVAMYCFMSELLLGEGKS